MKNINKIRVPFKGAIKVVIPFTLIFIIFVFCDITKEQRVNTEPVANIITETATTEAIATTTTTEEITTTIVETTTTTTSETTITTNTSTTSTTTEEINTTIVTGAIATEDTTETSTETYTDSNNSSTETFIGTFSRGTFYTIGSYGGSGRTLVSGYSIASRALYELYGYGDFKIRIECDSFPELNGIYSLDDCSAAGNYEVIDFWFAPNDVPSYFRKMGVFEVRAYLVQ